MLSSVVFSIVAAKSAKDNMKKFTSPGLQNLAGSLSLLAIGVITLLAMTTDVSRAQTNFASAEALGGFYGTMVNTNNAVVADVGAPPIDGFAPNAPLWYKWTAPQSGVVTIDTIGSTNLVVDTGTNAQEIVSSNLDTVLAVYTGNSLGTLDQVAANDNLFPINSSGSTASQGAVTSQFTESGSGDYIGAIGRPLFDYVQPFYGPSGLRFNAVGNQTYYFAVDTKIVPTSPFFLNPATGKGSVSLSWAYEPSGVFRFASEDVDPTSGMLLYQTAETESQPIDGSTPAGNSTILTYYDYNAPGVLVTVTRVAGSTGRATVDYQTVDGTALNLAPNDLPAFGEVTNIVEVTTNGLGKSVTNNVFVLPSYQPVSGTLVFDDFEMSKTILIPINYIPIAGDQTNRVFGVQLSSPALDPLENSQAVSPPRVDPVFSTAEVRILNSDADPYGPDMVPELVTNVVQGTNIVFTNLVAAEFPTNAIFNFEKANYRVPEDVNTTPEGYAQVTLWVERFGTNLSQQTVNYRVNNFLGDDQDSSEEQNIVCPLQPGSDFAVPTLPNQGDIRGTNSDFAMTEGTLNFPSTGGAAVFYQPSTFMVSENSLTKFNRDFKVQIYQEVTINGVTVPHLVGMVNEATVTILFNDQNPPAGSVDEFYNADFNTQMATYSGQVPVTQPTDNATPGVGLYGEVYSLTLLTNNESLIGGDFLSYNGIGQTGTGNNLMFINNLALINTNGQLDTSFNGVGSGPNAPVDAVALDGSQYFVGGSFTSFNGFPVGQNGGIARLNANGSVDQLFNPGFGPDGVVRAIAVLPNGEVLIGGDFTHINKASCNYIALLTTSGTLDPNFNPGSTITGPVYALALTGNQVLAGGNFSVSGQSSQNIARLNLDGSVDTTFNQNGQGADQVVHTLLPLPNGQILVGGEFLNYNGTSQSRIAELNPDGSLDSTNFYIGTGADNTVYCFDYATNITTNAVSGIVTTNNSIYVGGAFSSINGTHRLGFARLYANGLVDTTFLDTSYNQFAGLKKIYADDLPAVFTTGVQTDGNVLIGGFFYQVGGGQANTNVCDTLDESLGYPESFDNSSQWVEPKTRDGVRNRFGLARLVGGSTPGPGNLGLSLTSYSADKSQSSIPDVGMLRTNGFLGPVSANFAIQSGTAQSGQDYSFYGPAPLDWVDSQFLSNPSRDRADGLFGSSGQLSDAYDYPVTLPLSDNAINQLSVVSVSIINNTKSSGNLNAQFQLANPSLQDTFYLGGEEIPVGAALGISSAPLALVDDTSSPGTFGFSLPSFVATNSLVAISVVRSNGLSGNVSMRYSSTNGTALAGTDYTGVTNQILLFINGQSTNGFSLHINNTGYITNVEKTLTLSLFGLGSTPGATFGISNAVVRIINPNYPGFVTLGATNYVGAISSGAINFTVNRVVGSLGSVTVQYATANGSAVNGTDYIGATNTLTWNSGDVSPRVISIPLINPEVVSSTNKQFTVSLSNPTLNGASNPGLLTGLITNATLVITNDNSYGSLQFAQPVYTVSENGGYATINVVRTGGVVGTVSVNYATANGQNTTSGVNYTATNGVLVFAPNQTSASFTVPVLNDGQVDPANFFFNVVLSDPTNALLGSLTSVQVNLLDVQSYNQPPGDSDPSFDTNGVNGQVLSLALQTNGQILVAGNFTAAGSVLEGDIARLNTDGSPDISFLQNGLTGAAGAAINAVVCQTDSRVLVGGAFTTLDGVARNFVGRLMTDGSLDTSFNPGSGADGPVYALAETFVGGNREIYVGGAFGAINRTTTPGLARLNNNGSVDGSFVSGSDLDGQVYAIAVYPTNSIYAGKVLVGGLFNHYNGVGLTNFARLNVDGSVDTNFNSGLGSGPDSTVSAIAIQPDGRILVGGNFTHVNGTAVNYIVRLNTDGSVDTNFVAGIGTGANNSVQGIALQPDNRIVLVGQFTQFGGIIRNHITRLLPTGTIDPTINFGDGANGDVDAVVIQPANGMLVIGGSFNQYNDRSAANIARIYGESETGSGQFEFSAANYQVDEKNLLAAITIRRTGGTSGPNADGTGNIAVTFNTSDGTAIAGTNYSTVSQTVEFPAGEVLETVLVPVIDDHVITPNLTVNLALSNPTSPAILGNQPTATLTIVNDDSAVSFSSTYYSQDKNVPTGVAIIDILRQGGTNGTSTVNFYTVTNGATAVPGVDYYATNKTVTFIPGQSDVQVQVPIINNGLVEGNKTVGLVLTNAENTMLYAPSNAVLTIIDTTSSPGSLAFASSNTEVDESSGTVLLTVVRTNGTTGTVTATYTTSNLTAQAGVNYVGATGTVTISDGNSSNTIPITLVQNNLVQGTVAFMVTLSNPSVGVTLVAPTNEVVNIVSKNYGVSFLNATNYVQETNGFGLVTVQRIGETNTAFSVNYTTTTNGTAVAGVNYQTTAGTLTFGGNQVYQTISVPLYNRQDTTNLTFGLQLYNPNNGALLAYPSNAVVVIRPALAGLSFTSPSNSVQKNGGYVLIPVVCSNPTIEPVPSTNVGPLTVAYFTSDGTATANKDYTPTTGTLFFTNGVATNYIKVIIDNNSLVEGNRTFDVTLANPTAPGTLISPSTQVVTIIDLNSGLSFSSPTYTVLKTNGTATITVLRTDVTNTTSTVNFATADGTAVAGQDYIATNGTFTFTNGQTAETFAVTIIGNTPVQPDKTVLLQLFNATNGFLVSPYAATLTIHDTSGSLVVPAGSILTSESFAPANGIIDPGETVSLLFAFRASGGTNVNNVSATLQAANGITSPSPSSQNYGTLTVGGPLAYRPFSFTAKGTNGQQIAATFQLYSGASSLGTAIFTYTLGTWTNTFYNTNPIVISAYSIASPYPSIITVTNVGGDIIKATMTLTNLTATIPSGIDVLLVSPAQSDTLVMANAGKNNTVTKVTLDFDDSALTQLPQAGQIVSGTNQPSGFLPVPPFP